MKICNICKIKKSYNDFQKKKTEKDGYRKTCTKCVHNKLNLLYEKNKEKIKTINIEETKICYKCKIEKKLYEFYQDLYSKKMFSNVCILCEKEQQRNYRLLNKDKIKIKKEEYKKNNKDKISLLTEKRKNKFFKNNSIKDFSKINKICCRCKIEKNSEYFNKNYKRKDGLSPICKKCKKEDRKRYIKNENYKNKLYFYKHKRRIREKNLLFSFDIKIYETVTLKFWNYSCVVCGSKENLQKDHFIPIISKECPGTTLYNIIPLCRKCNLQKGSKNPKVFFDTFTYQKIINFFTQYYKF